MKYEIVDNTEILTLQDLDSEIFFIFSDGDDKNVWLVYKVDQRRHYILSFSNFKTMCVNKGSGMSSSPVTIVELDQPLKFIKKV